MSQTLGVIPCQYDAFISLNIFIYFHIYIK